MVSLETTMTTQVQLAAFSFEFDDKSWISIEISAPDMGHDQSQYKEQAEIPSS